MQQPSFFDNLRMKLASAVGGPTFERRYAGRVAEAIHEQVAGMPGYDSWVFEMLQDQLRTEIDTAKGNNGGIEFRRRNLREVMQLSDILYETDGIVRNICRNWLGLSASVPLVVDIDDGQRTVDGRDPRQVWEEFDERKGYTRKGGVFHRSVLNCLKHGERYHLWDMNLEDNELATDFRVLSPLGVGGIWDIETVKGDAQTIANYIRSGVPASERKIPAGFVSRWHMSDDDTVLRGAPIIEPVLDDILRFRQTAASIWWLQEVRVRLAALVHQRGRGQGALKAIKLPKVGITVLDVPPDDSIQWPNLKDITLGDRQDNSPDRILLQRIGAGVLLPWHMVAMEFRDAALASLKSASDTLTRQADTHSNRWVNLANDDVRHVVGPGVNFECSIPPCVIEEPAEQRRSWLEVRDAGYISQRTLHDKIGVDPDEEEARLEKERAEEDDNAAVRNPNQKDFADSGANPEGGDAPQQKDAA